jgi:hypothetical protein
LINSLHYPDNAESYHQIELPINTEDIAKNKIPEIHMLLQSQVRVIEQQHIDIQNLSEGVADLMMISYQQQLSDPIKTIEALKQQVTLLEKGIIKIYQHLEKDNTGKELKSGQQNLRKAIEANQKKTINNVSLDWKQIAIMITSTAIISSLCSLAVFQVVSNWKTDQLQNPVEKPLKTKSKKNLSKKT